MSKFDKPHEISDVLSAFPGRVSHLMPDYSSIPSEFKRMCNHWAEWQAEWFFSGLKQMPTAKEGIDLNAAMRHLQAIQGSYEPKHEHKSAAVAYLASKWLVAPVEQTRTGSQEPHAVAEAHEQDEKGEPT